MSLCEAYDSFLGACVREMHEAGPHIGAKKIAFSITSFVSNSDKGDWMRSGTGYSLHNIDGARIQQCKGCDDCRRRVLARHETEPGDCPIASCREKVRNHELFCAGHWAMVPPALQTAAMTAWDEYEKTSHGYLHFRESMLQAIRAVFVELDEQWRTWTAILATRLLCLRHWRMVPTQLQRAVNTTWEAFNRNGSQREQYLTARRAAIAAVIDQARRKEGDRTARVVRRAEGCGGAAMKSEVFVIMGESGSYREDTETWIVGYSPLRESAEAGAARAQLWARTEWARWTMARDRHLELHPEPDHYCRTCDRKPRSNPFDLTDEAFDNFRDNIRYFVVATRRLT